jgi:hypothetical protein
MTIVSNGNRIGSKSFSVRPIPAVEVKPFTDRGEVSMKAGLSATTPRLYLRAIPDAGFAEFLPDDAQFQVSEAEITLVSGGIGRGSVRGGGTVNLGAVAANARKGDAIVIEIKKVQRKNFKGEIEDFAQFNKFITIPLN